MALNSPDLQSFVKPLLTSLCSRFALQMIIFVYKGNIIFYGWRVDFVPQFRWRYFGYIFKTYVVFMEEMMFPSPKLTLQPGDLVGRSRSCVNRLSFLRCSVCASCLRQAMLWKKGTSLTFLCALNNSCNFLQKHFNDVGGRPLKIHPFEFLSQEIKCYSIKASVSFSTADVSLKLKNKIK